MLLGWYLSIKYQRTSIIGCSYAMGGYLSMKYLSLSSSNLTVLNYIFWSVYPSLVIRVVINIVSVIVDFLLHETN